MRNVVEARQFSVVPIVGFDEVPIHHTAGDLIALSAIGSRDVGLSRGHSGQHHANKEDEEGCLGRVHQKFKFKPMLIRRGDPRKSWR